MLYFCYGSNGLVMASGGKSGGGSGGRTKPVSPYAFSYVVASSSPGPVTIVGSLGDDTIAGVPLGVNPFDTSIFTDSNKRDILCGGSSSGAIDFSGEADGSDLFVLGNSQGVYYANWGGTDYAIITDYNVATDRIQFDAAASVLAIYDPSHAWPGGVDTGALLLYYVSGNLDFDQLASIGDESQLISKLTNDSDGFLDNVDLFAAVLSANYLSAWDMTWVDDNGSLITAEPPVLEVAYDDTVFGDGSTTGTALGSTSKADTLHGFVDWTGAAYITDYSEYGLAQIDYLSGGQDADIFQFADSYSSRANYYTSHGFDDYVFINEFDIATDKIQIWDSDDGVITAEVDVFDPNTLYLYWHDSSVLASSPDLFAILSGTSALRARDIQWLDQHGNPIQPANNDSVYGDASTTGTSLGVTPKADVIHGYVSFDGAQYVDDFTEYGEIQIDYAKGGQGADVYVFGDSSGQRNMYYTSHYELDYMIIDGFNVLEDYIRIFDTLDTVVTASWNADRSVMELFYNQSGLPALDKFAEIIPESGLEFSPSSIRWQDQYGNSLNPLDSIYSDTVVGNGANNILNGIYNDDGESEFFNSSERSSSLQIDTLTGQGGADIFVLGDKDGQFYCNGGTNDFVKISDYNPKLDKIQIYDDEDVYLTWAQSSRSTIQIYNYDLFGGGGLDLIAEIKFSSGSASVSGISWINQYGEPIASL